MMEIAMNGKKLLFGLGVMVFLVNPGFSQVITPSMDPTQSVLMPSAAGWREKPAAGFGYLEGSGTRDLHGEQIYQFDDSGMDGNLAFKAGNVFVEMYAAQKTTTVKYSIAYQGHMNFQSDDGRLNIALAGNDFVTIGLGARSTDSLDFIDAVYDSESTSALRTIGSISVKTMDMFYLGLGFERVKEQSSYAVDLTWNNLISGVAMHLGQSGGTQFRVEYSLALSESEENGLNGGEQESYHPATNISRLSAEMMFSGLLFSVVSEDIKMEVDMMENGESIKEISMTNTQGGVLWIPDNGLSIGFYFLANSAEASYSDSKSAFKVKVAYIFQ
jgi:hypothetical protein